MAEKHPTEIERANRMFAIEQAVRLGVSENHPTPVETARTFFNFLQESSPIPEKQVGFIAEETRNGN